MRWVLRRTTHFPQDCCRASVENGVISGVGSVIVFLPQILILFLFILILEDLGYMARAAFLMDRIMGGAGLHGRAFIPLLSSFACAIPGIMATRVIDNPRDRLTTILVAPLMTCSAPHSGLYPDYLGLHSRPSRCGASPTCKGSLCSVSTPPASSARSACHFSPNSSFGVTTRRRPSCWNSRLQAAASEKRGASALFTRAKIFLQRAGTTIFLHDGVDLVFGLISASA